VNNDPVNYTDPLGLQCISASDKNGPSAIERPVTPEERNAYTAATGRTMDFDRITIIEGRAPTEQEFREAAKSVGYDDSKFTKSDIENMTKGADAISLPNDTIYFKDPSPDIPFTVHELDHQETYQNGATVTRGGTEVQLNTPLEVFTELVDEATSNLLGKDPYSNPDMLEYRAEQARTNARANGIP
jgi:hypothetical protein